MSDERKQQNQQGGRGGQQQGGGQKPDQQRRQPIQKPGFVPEGEEEGGAPWPPCRFCCLRSSDINYS